MLNQGELRPLEARHPTRMVWTLSRARSRMQAGWSRTQWLSGTWRSGTKR
jgi:hypothetical protein